MEQAMLIAFAVFLLVLIFFLDLAMVYFVTLLVEKKRYGG